MFKKFLKELSLPESYISITLGFLVVVVAGLLLYNNFTRPTLNTTDNITQNLAANTTPGISPMSTPGSEKGLLSGLVPTTHTVINGENLWKIAEKYYSSGYNWQTIAKENNLSDPNLIAVGQKLSIPKSDVIRAVSDTISATATSRATQYTVVRGDNLWNIAVKEYGDGFMWNKIATANNLANPRLIHAGNVLKLPR